MYRSAEHLCHRQATSCSTEFFSYFLKLTYYDTFSYFMQNVHLNAHLGLPKSYYKYYISFLVYTVNLSERSACVLGLCNLHSDLLTKYMISDETSTNLCRRLQRFEHLLTVVSVLICYISL